MESRFNEKDSQKEAAYNHDSVSKYWCLGHSTGNDTAIDIVVSNVYNHTGRNAVGPGRILWMEVSDTRAR